MTAEEQDVRCVTNLCNIAIALIRKGQWLQASHKLKTACDTAKAAYVVHEKAEKA